MNPTVTSYTIYKGESMYEQEIQLQLNGNYMDDLHSVVAKSVISYLQPGQSLEYESDHSAPQAW